MFVPALAARSSKDGAIAPYRGDIARTGADDDGSVELALDGAPLIERLPAEALVAVVLTAPEEREFTRLLAAADPVRLGLDDVPAKVWSQLWSDGSPVTGALLRLDPPVFALGWRTRDGEALPAFLRAEHELRHTLRAFAVNDVGLVVRDDGTGPVFSWLEEEAWAVFGPELEPGDALHHALTLARPDPDEPFAAPGPLRAVLDRLAGPPAALAVINTPGLVRAALAPHADVPTLEALLRDEVNARALGDEDLAGRLMERRRGQADLAELLAGETGALRRFLRASLDSLGPAAIGVTAGDDAIELAWAQVVAPGTSPWELLQAGAGTLVAANDEPPAVRLALRLEPTRAGEWARRTAANVGIGALADFEARLSAIAGVDLRRDLIEASTGELALTLEIDRFTGALSPVARLGLRDGAVAAAALDRLAAALPSMTRIGEGRHVLDLPSAPRVWLGATSGELVASLDEVALVREASAAAPSEGPGPAPDAALDLDLDAAIVLPALVAWTDTDRDGDRVVDRLDACPDEVETARDRLGADGCPDVRPRCETVDVEPPLVFTTDGAELDPASVLRVDEVARALIENPWIRRVRIGVTAAEGGAALARRRRSWLRDALVARGLARGRLVAAVTSEQSPPPAQVTLEIDARDSTRACEPAGAWPTAEPAGWQELALAVAPDMGRVSLSLVPVAGGLHLRLRLAVKNAISAGAIVDRISTNHTRRSE